MSEDHGLGPEDPDTPNGWAILHIFDREDGQSGGYIHGPFPPGTDMPALLATVECDCMKTIVGVFIPAGITMMVEADDAVEAALQFVQPPRAELLN